MRDYFAIFILSYGRPDKVDTFRTIQRAGYTGKVFIIIDNEDKNADKYYDNFGDKVIMFDKAAAAENTDTGDNFPERNTVLFARNACFGIAENLGIEYFLVLDDDYTRIDYRFNGRNYAVQDGVKNFDGAVAAMLDYYESNPQFYTLCMLQSGDMIGGVKGGCAEKIKVFRKAMNTFICSTKRKFNFMARMNDDVTTYIKLGNMGKLFLSINNCTITQKTTQQNSGRLTKMYLDYGTYTKSFYSVMYQPSSVKVGMMGATHKRLHHSIDWDCTVPCIISERYKK